jgi:hypothetical protein
MYLQILREIVKKALVRIFGALIEIENQALSEHKHEVLPQESTYSAHLKRVT